MVVRKPSVNDLKSKETELSHDTFKPLSAIVSKPSKPDDERCKSCSYWIQAQDETRPEPDPGAKYQKVFEFNTEYVYSSKEEGAEIRSVRYRLVNQETKTKTTTSSHWVIERLKTHKDALGNEVSIWVFFGVIAGDMFIDRESSFKDVIS